MYKDGFVVSIMRDDRPLRESGRAVRLPFNSEYKVRLKNKNGVSCKARVSIDGTPVSQLGDFVISSWGTLDLERFVTDSLNKGKKFKFVSASDSRVQDPTSPENGIIRVEFYKATNGPLIITGKPWPYSPSWDWDEEIWPLNGSDNAGDGTVKIKYSDNTAQCFYSSSPVSMSYTNNLGDDKGATIEGGDSNQSFITVSDFDTDFDPVVIELELRAPRSASAPEPQRNYCGGCGVRRRGRDKFCPDCGRRHGGRGRRKKY